MNAYRFLYILSSLLIVVCPVIISFYIHIPELTQNLSVISLYGIYILFYTIIQMIFASLNRKNMNKLCKEELKTEKLYNILVVGYKEDPKLFKQCLLSHRKQLFNPNINRIIVVIDGDTDEDLYMANIFVEVFSYGGVVYKGGHPDYISHRAVCILQRHGGKRHVLYTGLVISCKEVYGVICSDSDTEMDKNAVKYLIQTLESSDSIGAVTGMMEISNPVSIISFLSYIRYWFACNLERAYQSYNGVVLCVSGPIGIYKCSVIQSSLDEFITQTFMGNPCTYGDDRHLTNKILEAGYQVKYNHLITCKTDTPTSVFRFFNQQTRWCKSSYRELLWTLKYVHNHSFWLSVDLLYQTVYSMIVVSSLVYVLIIQNTKVIIYYFLSIILVNIIKGFFALACTGELFYMLYSLYGFIYINFILPSKIYAGLTLGDTSWGTSSRKMIFDKINYGNVFMLGWICLLNSVIVYVLVSNPVSSVELDILIVICCYCSFFFLCIKMYSTYRVLN